MLQLSLYIIIFAIHAQLFSVTHKLKFRILLVEKKKTNVVTFLYLLNERWYDAGQEPVAYIGTRKWSAARSTDYAKIWNSSISETVKREPYLAFSILFICLRIFFFFFPKFFALIQDFWTEYYEQSNLGILAKLTHAVDVRKVWSKLRLMVGAKNGRIWASLASVSLGGQPSPRVAVGLMGSTI